MLVEMPEVAWTGQVFHQRAVHVHDPEHAMGPDTPYARPFQMLGPFISLLDSLQAAGAAGVIVILDMAATVRQVQTRNLGGILPGKSDELMVLASYTDGTNGLENNGPNAIVDMAQYLARLPQDSLPRSVMLLLTGGHLAGGAGIAQFMDRHKDDGLTQRMAEMLGIGQLGALEVLPDSNGYLHLTGRSEPAALFSPRTPVLRAASYAMLRQAGVAPAFMLPPANTGGDGSAQGAAWPVAGQTFRAAQRLPTLNYVKAPTHQLSYGIGTVTQMDYRLMQRETVALTQMLLDLSRVPYADLRKETAP
mgnify:CR=1 FL=1